MEELQGKSVALTISQEVNRRAMTGEICRS